MSVLACTAACDAAGYSIAGVEYASECYCDNYVSSSATNASITDCNMPCNGNGSEFCGAANRLDLYTAGNTNATPKPVTVTPPPPGGWFSIGCYSDSSSARSLSVPTYIQVPMTIEACTNACSTAGYTIAGLEYAGQCFCDNSLQNSAALVTDGRCNMECNGNSNEICGGPNGLSVYQLTGWYSQGCWNDTVGDRTLNHQQYGLPSMTVEVCTAACKKAGYTLAGMEYAGECYCDSAPMNYGGPAIDGNVGCNMACAGNANEMCGGPGRLNVYQFNSTGLPVVTTTSSAPGTTPTGGNGGSTALPTPSSSVNASAIAPFKYQGCYTEGNGGRAFANQQPDNSTMTVESCISLCSSQGYTVAGMEYADQCFCDNFIRYNASRVTDSQCNMGCAGNSGEMCGAGSILSVYSVGNLTDYTDATILKTNLPGSWQYAGCLTDADGTRSLAYQIVSQFNNTNEACLAQCQKFGYNAAGTEYGQQCFCGDIQNVINAGATIRPDSECNMVCSNDTGKNGGHYCGGPSRLSYYTWDESNPLYSWNFASGNDAGAYEFLIGGVTIPLVTSPARNGKVTYMEKFGTSPANNGTGAYELDLSMINNFTAAWRPMHVKSDVFCSASLTLPDKVGRQINIGGWANDATYGVRLYWPDGKPGVWGVNDWEENVAEVSLIDGRWYPTAMTMANGSILVMGGEKGSNGAAVPTLEVLPSPSGATQYCDYLDRTDPYNLYPFLAVLPSGGILIAYYNEARILDPVSLNTKSVLPNIPGAVNDFDGGRTYPFEGTAMILPQHAPYSDYMRVIICGGSVPGPEIALDNCVSIAPDQPNANWTIERMPSKRVITCMTALPDGTYLILNGAQQGRAGFGLATQPNYNAVLYDPSKPVNFRMTVMANTTVARLYHSEAVLLDDGRVLVSGSDPEDVRSFAPQEYRNEAFIPPYLMAGAPRPSFNLSNLDWSYGQQVSFSITPSGASSTSNYRVSLIGAVSSTHGNSMGQRTIFPATTCSGSTCTVTAPPNANVAPPSWHQMFLLDGNNIPSHATWIRIGGDPGALGNWPQFDDFTVPGMGAVEPIL
ncbi:hypothetical protein LTR78_000693 [Recurvomyces mirabilis]|uniref:WSC domain-containing protein n=1 Tax=Recurvomyces mirabilis TaxID=574656 RepID=A0AAE1C5Q9_9PEZI|nr:hypothetical protein LTR78_000693 [Recurvomyces mirabilis]KAK5158664.1 hypothetical protein LTS14_002771 [Recurvomyces mirabilis]